MSSSNTNDKEIFSKVSGEADRVKILKSALRGRIGFVCKGDKSSLFYFKPQTVLKDGSVHGEVKSIEGEIVLGDAFVNFTADKEKYFYQTRLAFQNNAYILSSSEKMFLLQRRAHFRVNLSNSEEKNILVIGYNVKKVFVDAECLDLSVGGLRIKLAPAALPVKIGDKLTLSVTVNGEKFQTQGGARHVRAEKDGLFVGLQFAGEDQELLNGIQKLVLDHQRLLTSSL